MNISSPTRRIFVGLALIGALLVLVGAAQASSKPAGMTKPEYRALLLRSQALNARYGLGTSTKPTDMSAHEYRALRLRGEALNREYGLGGSTAAVVRPQRATVVGDSGFAWGDFGLGAAAMLGLALLTGGLVAGSRIPRSRTAS